uniref:Uncharacterized protein n=1 Tax=viral metagenome TaxID=1070528 RepID=A0A6C0KS48_9ZZZZ
MTEYPFIGFRYSCLSPNEEFYNSTTCRFVQPKDSHFRSEQERICGQPGTQDANNLVLPACEKHKELYENLKQTFMSIREDKEKFAELLKPQPLTRSIGVNLSGDYV